MWRSGAPQRRVARGTPKGCRCTYVLLYAVALFALYRSTYGSGSISSTSWIKLLIFLKMCILSDLPSILLS